MTHLKIELNNGLIEEVSSSVISKLYDIVHSGNLDNTSNLIGRLHTTATYLDYIDYLEDTFKVNGVKLLIIDATKKYIMFADPEVLRVLVSRFGDGTGVTASDLSSVSLLPAGIFDYNTTIETFNELGQFTNITSMSYDCFRGCTNLRSIDLSNIQQFSSGNALNGCSKLGLDNNGILNLPKLNSTIGGSCLARCTSLVEVNIGSDVSSGNKISLIKNSTFDSCTNLEKVTGLSEVISLEGGVFYHCTKLKNLPDLNNSTALSIGDECFFECLALKCIDLTSLTISLVGKNNFYRCKNLIDLTTNDYTQASTAAATYTFNWASVPRGIFNGCALTNKSFSFPNITNIGDQSFLNSGVVGVNIPLGTSIEGSAFNGCTSLTSINLSNCTSLGENTFYGCTSLGTGLTLELNLTNQTRYPHDALANTKYTRLILHSPQLTDTYDPRYPLYEGMRLLTYLDLSDWRPAKSSFDNTLYGDASFYSNDSLVTYIAPITVNYIATIIGLLGNYSNFRYLILLATTPPGIQTNDNNNLPVEWFYNKGGNVHIYVPDSVKAAYLADPDWATIGGYDGSDTIADRLHGLSELPAGVWTTGLASQYLTPALLATS